MVAARSDPMLVQRYSRRTLQPPTVFDWPTPIPHPELPSEKGQLKHRCRGLGSTSIVVPRNAVPSLGTIAADSFRRVANRLVEVRHRCPVRSGKGCLQLRAQRVVSDAV